MLPVLTTNWHAPDAAASCGVSPGPGRARGATRRNAFGAGKKRRQLKHDANAQPMFFFSFFIAHSSACSSRSCELNSGSLPQLGSRGTIGIRKGLS